MNQPTRQARRLPIKTVLVAIMGLVGYLAWQGGLLDGGTAKAQLPGGLPHTADWVVTPVDQLELSNHLVLVNRQYGLDTDHNAYNLTYAWPNLPVAEQSMQLETTTHKPSHSYLALHQPASSTFPAVTATPKYKANFTTTRLTKLMSNHQAIVSTRQD